MQGAKQKMLMELSSVNGKLSMEILVGGIIHAVSEKYETNQLYWDKSITFNYFKLSDYRDWDGRNKIIGFPTKSFTTNVTLSIATLMEEIKLIIVEK